MMIGAMSGVSKDQCQEGYEVASAFQAGPPRILRLWAKDVVA